MHLMTLCKQQMLHGYWPCLHSYLWRSLASLSSSSSVTFQFFFSPWELTTTWGCVWVYRYSKLRLERSVECQLLWKLCLQRERHCHLLDIHHRLDLNWNCFFLSDHLQLKRRRGFSLLSKLTRLSRWKKLFLMQVCLSSYFKISNSYY